MQRQARDERHPGCVYRLPLLSAGSTLLAPKLRLCAYSMVFTPIKQAKKTAAQGRGEKLRVILQESRDDRRISRGHDGHGDAHGRVSW